MEFETFKQNLKVLEKELVLSNPLKINDSLTVSLILEGPLPLFLNIRFDPVDGIVWIDAPITYHLPQKLEDIQDLMIELFNDLIVREKKIGRLIASPDKSNLIFVKSLRLDPDHPQLLAEFLPIFVKEAKTWRKKVEMILKKNQELIDHSPHEIVDFSFNFS